MIKGFYHIWMTAHYFTVVSEQVRILLTSGLYDACEEISIGCIGRPEDKADLEMYITDLYPKFKIKYYSTNPKEFEFPTLRLIEKDNSDYVGFYFHTKGVTNPFETNIQIWRNWLNEAILWRWREHYERVCGDYDVSSVNFLRDPDHFSGNFWWFQRVYIDKLPKISSLQLLNRYHAEQWICMCDGREQYAEEFVEAGKDNFLIRYET